jgi:RND family efflux transporter MFP subunit
MATRTMHTEVDVPNPRFELVPGMYAYASIGLDHKENVLAVPIQALDRKSDKATVYVLDANNKVEARVVQTGIETPDQVEIISGLQPDDVVVVGGRSQVRPGQVVRPKFVAQTRIAEPGTGEN